MAKGKGKGFDTNSLRDFDEYEGTLNSITNTLGKQSDIYALINKKLEATKTLVGSIADKIDNATDLEDKHKKSIYDAAEAYKKSKQTIAEANLELKKGTLTQEEYNKAIQDSYKSYEKVVSAIDTSNASAKRTVATLNQMGEEMKSFAEAAKKSEERLGALGTALDGLGSSGIPLMGELSNALKNIGNKDAKGARMALTGLGAAAGALANKYFNAQGEAEIVAANDVTQTRIDGAKEVGRIESERQFIGRKIGLEVDQSRIDSANEVNRLTIEAAYAQQRAANQFAASMKSAAAEFAAASKTALFGNAIGGVGYASAQMQMAGIGADRVASAMSAAADATGKMPTAKIGADMAIMAQRTGQSEEGIASINEIFQRLDKVSASTALNLQEGVRAMADKAGVSLGTAMAEIAEASKDALSYQIKGSSQLAKQVIYAKSLGVSFNEVAKAGQSMVLNYKDSIKSEMSLSAMLGKNVNLSEVRAKFMAGDQEGAMKALQAQGLNPKDMNMFQQQALQQALGGMDLNSIQKISENTGRSGGNLAQGNAAGGNKGFLQRSTNAQASLAATQAQISADQAVVDAKLSQKITEAYLTSPGYSNYQNALLDQSKKQAELNTDMQAAFQQTPAYIKAIADSNKLAIERMFSENRNALIASVLGGLAGHISGGIIQGLANKNFKVGPTIAAPTKTTAGPLTKSGAPDMRFKANKIPGASMADDVAKAGMKTAGKKAGVKAAEKAGIKGIAKLGAKGLGKSVLKKIPIVGALAGLGFALSRAADGDWTGAALEIASGAAGTIPGIGTGASIAIDTALAAKDMGVFDKKPTASAKPAGASVAPKAAAPAVKAQAAKPVSKEEQAKPIAAGTKPTVDAVNAMGQKQIQAQKMVADKAKVTLTEAQYGTKLQKEMIAMLGITAQFLQQISENTKAEGQIQINGKVLNSALLNQARRSYAVARTA